MSRGNHGAAPVRGNRKDWSKTVCVVCAKTGGMECNDAHLATLKNWIREFSLTVKQPNAKAIHFKCEEQLKKLTTHKGKSNDRQNLSHVESRGR